MFVEPKKREASNIFGLCLGLPSWLWRSLRKRTITANKTWKNLQSWRSSSHKKLLGWWNMIKGHPFDIWWFGKGDSFFKYGHFLVSMLNYWGVSNKVKASETNIPCHVAREVRHHLSQQIAAALRMPLAQAPLFLWFWESGERHVLDA